MCGMYVCQTRVYPVCDVLFRLKAQVMRREAAMKTKWIVVREGPLDSKNDTPSLLHK